MTRITYEAEEVVARRLFNAEWREGDWYWEMYPQTNRWQLLARQILEAALPHLTDDGAVSPPADPTGAATPTAAERATPVGAGEATPSSQAIDRDALRDLLFSHYYDVRWSQERQGFRCVCGWLGEDHLSHATDEVLALIGGEPS